MYRTRSKKSILTKEITKNQHEKTQAEEAIKLILEQIPGLSPAEAIRLVELAYSEKYGRDFYYIQRLVNYVSSNPSIHTPAAVLTTLVKNNQDRTSKIERKRPSLSQVYSKESGNSLSYQKNEITADRRTGKKGPIDFSKYMPGGKYGNLLSATSDDATIG